MVVQEEINSILTEISGLNKQAIILIDFSDTLLGIEQNAREQWVLTYSLSLMIDKLSANMSVEEAIEYIDFNILQFFVGEDGPLFRSCLEYSDILSPYEQLLSNKNHLLSCICNKICLEYSDHTNCNCICHEQSSITQKKLTDLLPND